MFKGIAHFKDGHTEGIIKHEKAKATEIRYFTTESGAYMPYVHQFESGYQSIRHEFVCMDTGLAAPIKYIELI